MSQKKSRKRKSISAEGEELRQLRKSLGYSAVRFAEYLRVDESTVRRWEKGRAHIPHAVYIILHFLQREQDENNLPEEPEESMAADQEGMAAEDWDEPIVLGVHNQAAELSRESTTGEGE